VHANSLEQFIASDGGARFEAVLFFHLLEHLPDPFRFLTICRSVMSHDGILILSVPNERRLFLKIGREWWDKPPHHLTRFSETGLRRLLERTGFEVAASRFQPTDRSLPRGARACADHWFRTIYSASGIQHSKWIRRALKAGLIPPAALAVIRARKEVENDAGLSLYILAKAAA